ncbi:MAG: hypothetical protein ACR2NN_04560 [Bryobacteraceae bacterium]
MRDEDSAFTRGLAKDSQIIQPVKIGGLSSFKIDDGLPAPDGEDNMAPQVVVGLIANFTATVSILDGLVRGGHAVPDR